MLGSYITRAGGEVVVWPPIEGHSLTNAAVKKREVAPTPPVGSLSPPPDGPTPAPAAAAMASVYGPTPPQSFEQRLQRVEEKLDRVLQKLDRLTSDSHPPQR